MKHMLIGYLGLAGNYTHSAARRYFGEEHEYTAVGSMPALIQLLMSGQIQSAMLYLENNLTGSVHESYDVLFANPIHVVGEQYIKQERHLLGVKQAKLPEECMANITSLVSHPDTFNQCSFFMQQHPHITTIPTTDETAAIEYVSTQNNPLLATIGSTDAARIYNLMILQKNVSNDPLHDYSRFFAVSRSPTIASDANKCSIFFTLPHIPGSLVKVLSVFGNHNLSIIKLEARPIQGKLFEYVFFLDIAINTKTIGQAQIIIEECRSRTQSMRILGFYKSMEVKDIEN